MAANAVTQQLADELKLNIDKEDQLITLTFGSASPTQTASPSVEEELKTSRETTKKYEQMWYLTSHTEYLYPK